jgi:hypothetical protein
MTRLGNDRGQAMVMSVAFLAVLLGMSALVLDVGSWYRADRHAQTTADAAALAGAQGLNTSQSDASTLATQYAGKNEGAGATTDIAFPNASTIRVTVARPAPGFFSKLFGVDSVTVRAVAAARVGPPAEALYVAPIVVNEKHPDLTCMPGCAGRSTELEYHHLKADSSKGPSEPDGAGSFGFINLDKSDSNPGTSTMGGWIKNGFDKFMPLGAYDARTGNPFSSSSIEDNLDDRLGTILLFPIYRTLKETGSNAQYEIIGWVGFKLTGMDLHGTSEKLYGSFVSVIWQGIQGATGGSYSTGVGIVQLVE